MSARSLAALLLLLFTAGFAFADDPKLPETKVFDKMVIDSLREVHNKGADLYNEAKDFPGAYRLYQGALMAVRPLLGHRLEVQKIIDTGLAAAEKAPDLPDGKGPDFARKAFLLHETIENVRKHLKIAIGEKKPDDKKDDKKPDDKKKDELAKQSDLVEVAPPPRESKPR